MKIAIPTNNRTDIAERSGRAKEFAIIEINNNEFTILNFNKNKHEHHHHEHGKEHNHSHSELIDILTEVSAVIVKKVGIHLKSDLDKANIKIVLTKKDSIKEAVNEFIENN